jgi:hypothetical protein
MDTDTQNILSTNTGAHLVEATTPSTTESNTSMMISHRRAEKTINEPAWDLKDMLERPTLVKTLSWEIGAPTGTTLARLDIMKDILVNSIQAAPFQRFRYFRSDYIHLRIQVIGSRFFAGRLVAAFVPSMVPDTATVAFTNKQLIMLEPCFIDPTKGTVIDYKIPFVYFKQYLDLTREDTLGQFQINILNPYSAVAGSPANIVVKVFASIIGSEFKIPIPGGTPFNVESPLKAATPVGRFERQSGLIGMAASAAVPVLGSLVKKILPDNMFGDIIGGLLDKPQISTPPDPIINKVQGPLSPGEGPEYLETLQLYPGKQQFVDMEDFATSQDEMSMKFLLKKKSLIGMLNWSVTQDQGDLLYQQKIGPFGSFSPTNMPPPNVTLDMVDYLAHYFTHWRGGYVIYIEPVVTAFHEGRLDVAFHPSQSTVPADYTARLSQYYDSHTIRDANGPLVFKIPYLAPTPWKRVFNGTDLSDTPTDAAQEFTDYYLGMLSISVSAPLRAPSTVPSSVQVNMYIQAADDFELNTPSFSGQGWHQTGTFARRTETQSGEEEDMNNATSETVTLARDSALVSDGETRHFGEVYGNLRDMCKRYTPLGRYSVPLPSETNLRAQVISGQLPRILVVPISFELLTPTGLRVSPFNMNIMRLFRLFRGPMCYKVKLTQYDNSTNSWFSPPINGWVSFVPYGVPSTDEAYVYSLAKQFSNSRTNGDTLDANVSQQDIPRAYFTELQTAEFKVPYTSHFSTSVVLQPDEHIPSTFRSATYTYSLVIAAYTDVSTASALYADIHQSFGDESASGVFFKLPDMTLLKNQAPDFYS